MKTLAGDSPGCGPQIEKNAMAGYPLEQYWFIGDANGTVGDAASRSSCRCSCDDPRWQRLRFMRQYGRSHRVTGLLRRRACSQADRVLPTEAPSRPPFVCACRARQRHRDPPPAAPRTRFCGAASFATGVSASIRLSNRDLPSAVLTSCSTLPWLFPPTRSPSDGARPDSPRRCYPAPGRRNCTERNGGIGAKARRSSSRRQHQVRLMTLLRGRCHAWRVGQGDAPESASATWLHWSVFNLGFSRIRRSFTGVRGAFSAATLVTPSRCNACGARASNNLLWCDAGRNRR